MKKSKPLVRTDYCIQRAKDGKFWCPDLTWGSFAKAQTWPMRPRMINPKWWSGHAARIVEIRGRALSPRTKKSKKRTR